MAKFSIILPTLRRELLTQTIHCIRENSVSHKIEMVVVSPFETDGDDIVNVLELEQKGNCTAHASGYNRATGDIIVAMTDDHLPMPGWLDGVENIINEKESLDFPFLGGLHRPYCPYFGTVYGLYYAYFPVMSRRSVEAVGGWFSTDYRAHFGDSDLALRVWAAGGRCELMPGHRLLQNPAEDPETESTHKSTSLVNDFKTFTGKYHKAFGDRFPSPTMDLQAAFHSINFDYHLSELDDWSFMARVPPSQHNGRPHDWCEQPQPQRQRHSVPDMALADG